jgi:hypothetical protein
VTDADDGSGAGAVDARRVAKLENAGMPTLTERGRVFTDVFDFVTNYLTVVYARQVTDVNDTVWCPQWYEHPEAASRLNSLWRSWEHYRHDAVGQSQWWINHADPTMARLFDPKGTFKYCGVRTGHRTILKRLPVQLPGGYPPERLTTGLFSPETLHSFGPPAAPPPPAAN